LLLPLRVGNPELAGVLCIANSRSCQATKQGVSLIGPQLRNGRLGETVREGYLRDALVRHQQRNVCLPAAGFEFVATELAQGETR
jgi:hypothetical protein